MSWMIRCACGVLLCLPLLSFAADDTPPLPPGGEYVGSDICSECHEEKFEQILPSKHAQFNDLRTPFAKNGCETCHGRGEAHAMSDGEDYTGLIVYGRQTRTLGEQQNEQCLGCHQDTGSLLW